MGEISQDMVDAVDREKLINDLQEFANRLGKTPTTRELNEYGPHYAKRYQDEFGSWNTALEAADLEPNQFYDVTQEDLLEDIKRVAGVLGKTPTLNEMDQYGNYSKLTYQNKLDSYVGTLESLDLEPSYKQYNFSNQERPTKLKTTENVRKLQEDGPTPASELPQSSVGSSDKQYGLAKFSISAGKTGDSLSEAIYYLFDDQNPEEVIRKFFDTNPHVLENRRRKSISQDIGGFGDKWASAAESILDERYD